MFFFPAIKVRSFSARHCLIALNCFALFIFGAICINPSVEAAPEQEKNLTIIHTNDEHGALIPHSPAIDNHPQKDNPTIGGYARLAKAVQQIREDKESSSEPVILLSGGDYIGGTAYSWLVPEGYAPELTLKQILGYDAVVIGNHEYDYGPDVLADYLLEAGYPDAHDKTAVLASNTKAPPDHPLAENDLYRNSKLIVLDHGLKVGMFGLIGKDAISVTTANEPVEFTDQHETARLMVDQLKEQGAQMIIAITHSGVEEDRDLARDVPGINIIVGGHCHTALEDPVIEGETVIVQAGAHLESFGQLELVFNPSTDELRILNEENDVPFLHRLDHSYPPDLEIEQAIESYTEKLNEMIAEKTDDRFQHILDTAALSDFKILNHPPLQESMFGNFVTDAMRLVTDQKTEHEPDFAIQANGAIRGSVNPGTMPHSFGKVSFYDLVELVGLGKGPDGSAGYPIVAAYLTGEEMVRVLEVAVLLKETMGDTYFLQFSGLRYDYNPQNAVLFTVPFLDLPIPSTRAVTSAERFVGDGRQGFVEEEYIPIEKDDQELYCLITDSYLVSFLPMIGEIVPQLDIVLKDKAGNPVTEEDLENLIVQVNGEELKVWQTVLEYTANQPEGDSGLPEIDPYYASPADRINPVWSFPLIAWPILASLLLITGLFLLIKRKTKL